MPRDALRGRRLGADGSDCLLLSAELRDEPIDVGKEISAPGMSLRAINGDLLRRFADHYDKDAPSTCRY